jgi:hypothetical protein
LPPRWVILVPLHCGSDHRGHGLVSDYYRTDDDDADYQMHPKYMSPFIETIAMLDAFYYGRELYRFNPVHPLL